MSGSPSYVGFTPVSAMVDYGMVGVISRGCVLTNGERVRRHNANSAACVACGDVVEDLDHLLRHCEVKVFWTSIVRHDRLVEFLSLPYPGWVRINLQDLLYFSNSDPDWDILFGDILWKLWLFRNRRNSDLDNELSDIVMGVFDGIASYGGVIQDSNVTWITGFSKFIGRCFALEVEFWAVYEGLRCAKRLNVSEVFVESDNLDVFQVLSSTMRRSIYSSLLGPIQGLDEGVGLFA
ncbi:hypothetical protein V6N12_020227 [Hibiscus sabdariffa]|uniref:RNase H type-1 domain-containing protein n=1 Tax=Hibiscus sabdariffa TaxID=183260 RepID=A0ABR2BMS5_9ROSI